MARMSLGSGSSQQASKKQRQIEATKQIDRLQSVRVSKQDMKRIEQVGYAAWSHEQDRKSR